jgi:hypothetical protein
MTDARLRALRRLVRGGETPRDLVDELRDVALRLARLRLLPPSFAPYGHWDDEAAEDAFGAWHAERLLGQGHLRALLDRARTPGGFRRLAERSLRQHLLAAQDRSQAHNLYRRVVGLLEGGDRFVLVRDAARPQDRWYGLALDVQPWTDAERELAAHAWALGDFAVIRYRAGAAKLSPVLEAAELERFATGLMERLGTALTPALVMRALSVRFDLGAAEFRSLDAPETWPEPEVSAEESELLLRDTARYVLAGLSPRQAAVLRATIEEEPVATMAAQLGCSTGTIVNEQRRIGEVVTRLSADFEERDRLLNIVADLIYSENDE